MGRGVLYGGKYENFDPATPSSSHSGGFNHGINALPYLNPLDLADPNYLIEGIVLIEPNGYCLTVHYRLNGKVKNVKCLAFRYSTDGVGSTLYGTVQNCFFKVNDDGLKLYLSHSIYEDITIFLQNNGAAFQITWNMENTPIGTFKNVLVRRVDVIRTVPAIQIRGRSIINVGGVEGATFADYIFEDI